MLRRLAAVALLASCGPALPQGADHPASARAPEAPVPSLATALTGDPAPPPEGVEPAARAFATDGDEGVRPPVFGIAVPREGAPLPSRETGPEAGEPQPAEHVEHPPEHEEHAGHH